MTDLQKADSTALALNTLEMQIRVLGAERDRYKAALERIRTHDVHTDTDRYEACFDAIQQVADDALKGADAEANSPHSRAV